MSNNLSDEFNKQAALQKITEMKEAEKLRTNAQLRPKPPENTMPRQNEAPLGMHGTQSVLDRQKDIQTIQAVAEIQRQKAAEKARI